jgi:hypothetical protein
MLLEAKRSCISKRTPLFLIALAWSAIATVQLARAEEGCPARQLPSSIDSAEPCKPLSKFTRLPLDPSQPMVFEAVQLSLTNIFIQALGTITPDTPGQLEKFLKTEDAGMTRNIYFHSLGGDLGAGMKLGEIIRKAGYNTSIDRWIPLDGMEAYDYKNPACVGACALAFLGGVTRFYDKDDRYGLPQLNASGPNAGDKAHRVAHYLERMGVNPSVLQASSNAVVEGDIINVPAALGRQMKIIYDPSSETEFRIENSKGGAVARFDFSKREKTFRGMLRCIDGTATLFVLDRGDSIPPDLRTIKNAAAEFVDGRGKTLQASASYTRSGTTGTMAFRIPELAATSFSGDGLRLDDIRNEEIEQRQAFDPKGGLNDKMAWLDSVMAFAFIIRASNGPATLPRALRQCATR